MFFNSDRFDLKPRTPQSVVPIASLAEGPARSVVVASVRNEKVHSAQTEADSRLSSATWFAAQIVDDSQSNGTPQPA
jgi:hypothetical protein